MGELHACCQFTCNAAAIAFSDMERMALASVQAALRKADLRACLDKVD